MPRGGGIAVLQRALLERDRIDGEIEEATRRIAALEGGMCRDAPLEGGVLQLRQGGGYGRTYRPGTLVGANEYDRD